VRVDEQKISTMVGFEPTRAKHNGLAIHRLNHSATLSPFCCFLEQLTAYTIPSHEQHTSTHTNQSITILYLLSQFKHKQPTHAFYHLSHCTSHTISHYLHHTTTHSFTLLCSNCFHANFFNISLHCSLKENNPLLHERTENKPPNTSGKHQQHVSKEQEHDTNHYCCSLLDYCLTQVVIN
jgi:hypothetical protein